MMQMPIQFFYGISFLFLYVVIFVMPRQKDSLNLYNDIWLIGIFGLIHGLHEFIEFLIIFGGPFDVWLLKVIGSLLLPASFISLIIFSTRVIIRRMPSFKWLRALWPVCLSVWAAISILCRDFLIAGIAARYFIALPATLLVSFALYTAVLKVDKKQVSRDVYISAVAAIAAFFIYGILTGFVVPKADFLLARFINYPNFISFFGLPVQFFRMICAIIITAACMGMFRLFRYNMVVSKVLLTMAAAIFLVELGIMFILDRIFPYLPMVTKALLDSTLLMVLLFPLIYVMVLVPLFTDITERKKAEEEIKRNYDVQNVLDSLLRFSLQAVTIDEVLRYAFDLIVSIPWLSFEHNSSIFLVEDEPQVLVMKARKGVSEFMQKSCARVPFGRCVCGQAALTKKVQFVDHVDERHEIRYEDIAPHGHYCVPIISSDKVFGVLNIYVREGHSYNQKEEYFLSAIANTLAGVIVRKQAEEALRESEEKYRFLFEGMPLPITITTLNGRVVMANRACEEQSGYAIEEFIALKDVSEIYVDRAQRKQIVALLQKEGKVRDFETLLKHKSGAVYHVLINADSIKLAGEQVIMASVRDITRRKEIEEKERKHLQELEVFYKANIGREERIIELKKEIEQLKKEPGK